MTTVKFMLATNHPYPISSLEEYKTNKDWRCCFLPKTCEKTEKAMQYLLAEYGTNTNSLYKRNGIFSRQKISHAIVPFYNNYLNPYSGQPKRFAGFFYAYKDEKHIKKETLRIMMRFVPDFTKPKKPLTKSTCCVIS